MKKRLLLPALAVLLCIGAAACGFHSTRGQSEDFWIRFREKLERLENLPSPEPAADWAIYWYLCGSDLESDGGFATEDLMELLAVDLPDSVQVVIQTGGTAYWENDWIDPDRTERYLYTGGELQLLEQRPMANMGAPQTLAEFLHFCEKNFPAERTMVLLWNHGGGSVAGVAFDENFGHDSLTPAELSQAFHQVYGDHPAQPPVEVVGFDACLMATIDTAAAVAGSARYMVASEEFEPSGGWYYTGFLERLAADSDMDGEALGRVICDSFMEGCDWLSAKESTLSVVDLQALEPLLKAYNKMGMEALGCAVEDPAFFGAFGRQAERAEHYGGSTRDMGYGNLVDLGDLSLHCADLLPRSAGAVRRALKECVCYQVRGAYRQKGWGLSCYYSYDGDPEELEAYLQEGCSPPFQYLYCYGLEGELPREGMAFVNAMGIQEAVLPHVPDLEQDGQTDYPLQLDAENRAVLELDQKTLDMVTGVYFELALVEEDADQMVLLGRDNDLLADWETGVFRDNFRGVWGTLDGHFVYLEVEEEGEDYTAYSVPILCNGEACSLQVVYDYGEGAYHMLGTRQGLDHGMADRKLRKLQPGDVITTLRYTATFTGPDDFEAEAGEEFCVTKNTAFTEKPLPDGTYLLAFVLVDARSNEVSSELVQITVDGGTHTAKLLH